MALSDAEDSNKPEFFEQIEDGDNGPSTDIKPSVDELDDDEIGDLNMDELGSKVWLVKVPSFLADKWKQQRKEGVQIGKMRIYHKPDKTASEIAIILNDTSEYQDIPKEYKMQVTNEKVRNMFIFSESRDPNEPVKPTSSTANKAVPIAMTGTVHHECTVTPQYTEEYKRIMHKRVMDQHENSRKVRVVGLDSYHKTPMGVNTGGFNTTHKKQKAEPKLARMDRKDLMDMLFAAFARFPYWPLKDLVKHTRQPSTYLKEVLLEVAFLNKRGPYATMYSLKPEFRKDNIGASGANAGQASADGNQEAAGEDNDNNQEDEDDFEDV
ncbi:hypothetical protein FB645_004237 [Coemansia sp. IMI 203386]|nr:hypothetical protein FB645_004237 [Coemansia sp. IMI 203386]